MTRFVTLFAGLALLAGTAAAQISIAESDFTAQTGTTFEELLAGENGGPLPGDLSELESIMRHNGNNGVFNFAGIVPGLTSFSINEYLPLPPGEGETYPGFESHFVDRATDVWRVKIPDVPDAFLYRRITPDSLTWLGNAVSLDTDQDGLLEDVVNVFRNPKLQTPLPMTLGASWQSDFTHIGFVTTPIGPIEVPGIREIHDIAVDGYGRLVMPSGEYPCLRVRINQTIMHPDGTTDEHGGWTFVTPDLIQVGIFYNRLVPDNPADIDFDVQQPRYISAFVPAEVGTSITKEVPLPNSSFALHTNYPNPFSTSTAIPFTLENSSQVHLAIYDVLGREIAVPIEQAMPAGTHNVQWDAGQSPAGLYIYRLTVDGQSSERLMTLIR